MTRKSSKLSLTELFTSARAVVLMLSLCVGGGIRSLHAQQPAPPKEPKSFIRFWNMLPVNPANNLLVLSGDKTMFGAAPFDFYTDYFVSPIGSYILVIKRLGEKQDPLQRVPVALQDGTYITLLATDKGGGQVNIQLINDTPDPKVIDLAASLVVRSFFTGGKVTVGVTGGQPPQPIPDNAIVTLDNLPLTAGVNVTVQVTMPTTPPTSKSLDLPADFSVAHHATLLLAPDRYGRLKPRLVYNGYVAHPEEQQGRDKERR